MNTKKFDNTIELNKSKLILNILIGTLLPIVLLAIILSSIYLDNLKKVHSSNLDQLKENILAEKKIFLHDAIERTISEIENIRTITMEENRSKNLTQKDIDTITIDKISKYIKGLRLTKEKYYIWVNKIINYDGGDNYAIRAIHPNLPDTVGTLLSTNTKDIKGNTPYKTELDGIKKEGELYYDYYFKKLNSDTIAHKLSFAKLYKPYDWVIATGIYLDDFDKLIMEKNNKIEENFNNQKNISIVISMVSMILLVIFIFYFLYKIKKLIFSYETEIECYITKIETLATTDLLTGLCNRLELDNIYTNELEKAKRYNTEFSLIMIDIDYFKNVNDTYGHQVGDSVLKEFSDILKSTVRTVDTIGRWGGEEFLIICPETNLDGALQLAEHIRNRIESNDFNIAGRKTSSFGVSSYHKNDTAAAMLKRADDALYCAKEDGRNKVYAEV